MNEFTARSGPVLLLSDLHLPASPSPLRETFLRFLAGPAMEARSVYILGDLFEVWIGDDVGLADRTDQLCRLADAQLLKKLALHDLPLVLVVYQTRSPMAWGAPTASASSRACTASGISWPSGPTAFSPWMPLAMNRQARKNVGIWLKRM